MSNIREALVKIVEARNITQKALAESVGSTQGNVSNLLNGKRRINHELLEKICDALGVKLSDLENWNPELAEIRFTAANNGEAASPELMRAQQKLSRLYRSNRQAFDGVAVLIDHGLKPAKPDAAEGVGKKAR